MKSFKLQYYNVFFFVTAYELELIEFHPRMIYCACLQNLRYPTSNCRQLHGPTVFERGKALVSRARFAGLKSGFVGFLSIKNEPKLLKDAGIIPRNLFLLWTIIIVRGEYVY